MKGGALRLTADQVETALWAVRDLHTRRGLENRVPLGLADLFHLLEAASVHGTENSCDAVELEDEFFIDSDEAAAILCCTPRWVRHVHADLDGRKIAGRWAFRRHAVVEYAEERKGVRGDSNRVSPNGCGAVPTRAA
jgi:hypothetical protein